MKDDVEVDTNTDPEVAGAVTGPITVTQYPGGGRRFSAWRNRALGTYWELKSELDSLNLSLRDAAPPADAIVKRRLYAAYARLLDAYIVTAPDVLVFPEGAGWWRKRGISLKRRWASFSSIWRGSDSDRVTIAFADVRVAIVESTRVTAANAGGLLIDVQAKAAQILKPKDPRLAALAELKLPLPTESDSSPSGTMSKAAVALRAANAATSENLRQVRDFRNVLILTTVVISLGALILCGVGFWSPNSLNLCWSIPDGADPMPDGDTICPTGSTSPASGDVALVALLGLLGAAVTGAIAIRNLRGTSTPYGVPLWSILIKLPIGAITAILGLLLLHVLDGFALTSQQAILSWALVFGVSQETFTRLIDLRAQSLLESVPTSVRSTTEDPATAQGKLA